MESMSGRMVGRNILEMLQYTWLQVRKNSEIVSRFNSIRCDAACSIRMLIQAHLV